MKLDKLNLQGKGELLNEFELKSIKGGYYVYEGCKNLNNSFDPPTQCSGYCDSRGGTCQEKVIATAYWCVCE